MSFIWGSTGGGGSYLAGIGLALVGLTFSIDTSVVVDKTTAQVLTNKTLTAPKISALGVGDLLVGGAANAVSALPDVAVNQVLTSGGVGAAPAWSGSPTLAGLAVTGLATFNTAISCPGSAGATTFQAGLNALASNSSTTALGVSAVAQGAFSVAVGSSANAGSGAIAGIALGASASTSHSRAIVLGTGGNSTAANQFVVFFNDTVVSSMYLGNGVVATAPANTSINATGGSGANKTGAALGLNGGRGTGTGAGGPVTVCTTKAGASSSTLATLVERLRVDSLGNLLINATTPGTDAERVLALGNSSVVAPTTSADLVQMYAVDLSADNCTLGLFTERAVAADAAVVSTHSLSIVVNGTTYRLLLAT